MWFFITVQQSKNLSKFGTVFWNRSINNWHRLLVSQIKSFLPWNIKSECRLVLDIVLLDCDTDSSSFLTCYFKHMTHYSFLKRTALQYRNDSKAFTTVNKSITNSRDCFFFFFLNEVDLLRLFIWSKFFLLGYLETSSKVSYFLVNIWEQKNSPFFFDSSKTHYN